LRITLDSSHEHDNNPTMTKSKVYTFYIVAMVAALLNEIATAYGIQAFTLLPLLLAVALVGFWAFDVK
jgi:hypothetical protein